MSVATGNEDATGSATGSDGAANASGPAETGAEGDELQASEAEEFNARLSSMENALMGAISEKRHASITRCTLHYIHLPSGASEGTLVTIPVPLVIEIVSKGNVYTQSYVALGAFKGKPIKSMPCKDSEEIRKTFNIINDFTPAEEAQVREENKWCEEA